MADKIYKSKYTGEQVDAILKKASGIDETNLVHNTGDESVAGVKDFSDGIKIEGKNVATEEFVEESVQEALKDVSTGGGSIDESNLVHKTGDEEISGHKTFSDGIIAEYIFGNDMRIVSDIMRIDSNSGMSLFNDSASKPMSILSGEDYIQMGYTSLGKHGNMTINAKETLDIDCKEIDLKSNSLSVNTNGGETVVTGDAMQIDLGSNFVVNTETEITLNSPYQPISLNGKAVVLKDINDEGISIDGNNNLTIDSGQVQINSWMDTHVDASGYIMLTSKDGGVNIAVENTNNDIDLSSSRNVNLFAENNIKIQAEKNINVTAEQNLTLLGAEDTYLAAETGNVQVSAIEGNVTITSDNGTIDLIAYPPEGTPKATLNGEEIATVSYVDTAIKSAIEEALSKFVNVSEVGQ